MPDNLFPEATVTPSASKLAFAETTFGGDTVFVGGCFGGIITGAEGSRTYTPIVAGAGAADGGTQRIIHASDDPAVVALQILDNAISGNEMQVDVLTMPTVTVADGGGSLTVDGTVAATQSGLWSVGISSGNVTVNGTVNIDGAAASGTADAMNPVKAGGKYNSTKPTFTDGQVGDLQLGTRGALGVTLFPENSTTAAPFAGGTEAAALRVTIANDSTGVLSVDDNGGSITVDGTFWQATQPVSGTFWQATQPVSGTVTANLAAGTNNIGDVDVLSLPAIPAGTNNIGDVDVLTIAAGDNNIGNVDIVTVPADPFGVNADAASATGSISAKLRFIASTGIPITGTVTVGAHAVTNAGTFATQESGTHVQVDDAAFTPATSKVMMAGFEADETATDSVDEGDGGAARMTLDRKQIVTVQPHTAGGLSVFRSLDLDETEEEVKATAGCLYKLRITNFATSTRYVKLYNLTAANTTVGSSTPIDTIPIPPAAASGATVLTESYGGVGLTFDTALCLAATTALADADTGAPAANDVVISAYFK